MASPACSLAEEPTSERRTRTHRRNLRRTPSTAADSQLWLAATTGDVASLCEALDEASIGTGLGELRYGELSLSDINRKSTLHLLHEAARGGHVDCVQLLLERGADIEVRAQGLTALEVARQSGHPAVVRLLKEEHHRQSHVQAKALLTRQAQACTLAEQAEAVMRAGEELGEAAITAAQLSAAVVAPSGSQEAGKSSRQIRSAAEQLSRLRDRICRLSCELLVSHEGLAPAPAELASWLSTQSARELLLDLAEALPGREHAPDESTSPTEVALSVRVAQLRLREASSTKLGRVLGQDDLIPLLEQLLIAAAPVAAYSAQQRLVQIADDELLRKPDLASAVDGWIQAVGGVEHQAVGAWRAAVREATFWRALSRSPPPNALMMAICEQKVNEPLEAVFARFLSHLAADEGDAWRHAKSVAGYQMSLQRAVDEMLPIGDVIYVNYSV
eukprot:jgi/Chrpa1/5318/Chrysochromulina_OHIO_Genome00014576-RA